jgi:hypothetical protein
VNPWFIIVDVEEDGDGEGVNGDKAFNLWLDIIKFRSIPRIFKEGYNHLQKCAYLKI